MATPPQLPELRPLQLEDRELFDRCLERARPEQSELTFTNLFIWRNAYSLRVGMHGEALCVLAMRPDPEESFAFGPIGTQGPEAALACLELLRQAGHNARLARVTAGDIARLELDGPGFETRPDRGNADYVYLVEDLSRLQSSKYRNKRSHIAQFENAYPFWEYRRLTAELVPQCVALQDAWCDEKHCDLVATLMAEHRAVREVLEHLDDLSVSGGVILVDDRVEAFTLGEPLNEETVVIHIEKANGELHGLYQVINQQFLLHEWQDFRFVNREQDLGVEGLRQAKLSYYPNHLVDKYIVTPS